jgi:hypothetical protein
MNLPNGGHLTGYPPKRQAVNNFFETAGFA